VKYLVFSVPEGKTPQPLKLTILGFWGTRMTQTVTDIHGFFYMGSNEKKRLRAYSPPRLLRSHPSREGNLFATTEKLKPSRLIFLKLLALPQPPLMCHGKVCTFVHSKVGAFGAVC
jgi:hypothetical protein